MTARLSSALRERRSLSSLFFRALSSSVCMKAFDCRSNSSIAWPARLQILFAGPFPSLTASTSSPAYFIATASRSSSRATRRSSADLCLSLQLLEIIFGFLGGNIEVLAGDIDDLLLNPESPCDLDARRSTGEADQQLVCRLQCFFVKFDRGVDDTFVIGGVHFQPAIMGRRDDLRTAVSAEMIDYGNAERRAFLGVGAGPGLVQQNERRRDAFADHPGDVRHMRRECREIRRERLVVADVGEDRSVEGNSGFAAREPAVPRSPSG